MTRKPSAELFPYTTLFRSGIEKLIAQKCEAAAKGGEGDAAGETVAGDVAADDGKATVNDEIVVVVPADFGRRQDRKSTRLNSSHRCISYAVFCLKKKKKKK